MSSSRYIVLPTRPEDDSGSSKIKKVRKKRAPGSSAQLSGDPPNPKNFLVAGGGRNLQRQLQGQLDELTQSAQKELKKANAALAQELVRERAEHDQDISDAHATIQHLQSALATSQHKLGTIEGETANRISDATRAVEELRAQLNEEQVLRRGDDSQCLRLASTVQSLEDEVQVLKKSLSERESEATKWSERHTQCAEQLSVAKDSLADVQCRLAETSKQLEDQQSATLQYRREVDGLKAQLESVSSSQRATEARTLQYREDAAQLKQKHAASENEVVRLTQLLEIEKDVHSQAKEDLQALRLENKDLIAQKARDAALVATAEDLRRQWETVQLERNALESAMVARNAEVEHLKADNQRYASEWDCREKSLVSSHELRIQHLLSDLTSKDKHNSDLHNSLHKAQVDIQSYKAELQSTQNQLQAFRERTSAAEATSTRVAADLDGVKQSLKDTLLELEDLRRLHSKKMSDMQDELAHEHQCACNAQRAADVCKEELAAAEQAATTAASAHQEELSRKNQKIVELAASESDLLQQKAQLESELAATKAASEQEAASARQALERVSHEAEALKLAVESSALSLERSAAERERLQQELATTSGNMERIRTQLAAEREEMARFAAEAHSIQSEHQQELASKDAVMQEVLAAMQSEEVAKLAAQEQLRTQKERAHQVERELAAVSTQLDERAETVKDLKMERDELQAALERTRKNAEEAKRSADASRRQLEADLRAANRKPASGRAHDLWRRRSAAAMGADEDPSGVLAGSLAGSMRGSAHVSRSGDAGNLSGSADEGPLSSYQRRLNELRAKRI